MFRFALYLLVSFCLAAPALAQNGTVVRFGLTGHYTDPGRPSGPAGTLSGTITVDIRTGIIEKVAFDYSGRSPQQSQTPWVTGTFDGLTEITQDFMTPEGQGFHALNLFLPVSTLVGYAGGPICSAAKACMGTSKVTYTSHFSNRLKATTVPEGELLKLSATELAAGQ